MNYRNDQFFESDVFSDGRNDPTEKSNPPFIYPDRVVRVLKEDDPRNRSTNGNSLTSSAVTLDRGFMRNLNTNLGGGETLPKRRLNFQFNPQDIQQVVSQREGMYLSILQDPAQFLQPTAGSTSFAFDLLFDRTMEVANNTGQTADLQNPGPDDAYDIGVLADLNQLYTIIGQGFSKDLLDYQTRKMKTDARAEYNSNIDDFKDDKGNVTLNYDTNAPLALNNFASSVNLGNAAFLIPQPVRIVFSSLFMVDGFVTSTDIQFTKFNTNMVPIQCKVILQVTAIYIGFARDKTFLTNQLDQAASLRTAEVEAAKDAQKSNLSLYQQYLNKLRIGFAFDGRIIGTSPRNTEQFFEFMEFSGFATRGWSARTDGAAATHITPGIVASFWTSEVGRTIREDNPIRSLYENGSTTKIQQTIFVDVYGPYDDLQTATQEKNAGGPYTKKKVGQYSIQRTSVDVDSWEKAISYAMENENLNTANVSPYAITPQNVQDYNIGLTNWDGSGNRPDIEVVKTALKDKYFVVYISARVEITETVGDAVNTVKKFSNKTTVYEGSDTGKNEVFKFQWVSSTLPDRIDN
jgi:hypothetical protein